MSDAGLSIASSMIRAILAVCLLIAASCLSGAQGPATEGDGLGMGGPGFETVETEETGSPFADFHEDRDVGIAGCGLCAGELQGEGETDRLYVAKVLGITFANLTTSGVHATQPTPGVSPAWSSSTSNNCGLFSAALAGGVRVPRHIGAVRFECEGALRDNFNQALNPANETLISVRANDNWSVLANAWRELQVTDRFVAYAGGGMGGGGYGLSVAGPHGAVASRQAAVFAWQAGGGAAWRYNSLIDLDLGYRFLDFGPIDASLIQPGVGAVGTVSSKMTAGELFFMLRVYEPFQWAKHLRSRQFYMPE